LLFFFFLSRSFPFDSCSKKMSWRGATEFLWYRVVAQIVAVQIGFWALFAVVIALLDLTMGLPVADTLKQMFDWRCCFRFDSVRGYVTMVMRNDN
jgi:hypothetical protein